MIGKRTLAAGTATTTAIIALGGVAVGAWGPQPKPPKTVTEAPLVITDVRTVRKTVHVKPKARPVARPSTSSSGSGQTYAVSNPPAASQSSYSGGTSSRSSYSAPSVSTHASGGGHSAEREHDDGGERENHDEEGED